MFSLINRYFDIDEYLEKNHVKNLHELADSEIFELYKFAFFQVAKANISEVYVKAKYEDIAKKALQTLQLKGFVLTQNDFDSSDVIYINSLLDWSDEQLEKISMHARSKAIYINFYRSLQEAGLIDKIYGKSPALVLEDFGFLDRDCYLVGCNYMEKDEIEVIAKDNVKIVLTPMSDMIKGNGAINILPIINSGIQILLGSGPCPIIDIEKEQLLAKGNTANMLHISINDKSIDFKLETSDTIKKTNYDETKALKIIRRETK